MITLHANAKINLMLAVTGRREDGYHTLDTVMQSVGLYNRLTFSRGDDFTLSCDDALVPTDERNTAYRAAMLFFEKTGKPRDAVIHIEKHIPYEAGLGSASADAAGTLIGLDRLYETELSDEQLSEMAVSVGADVPFCLFGGTKRATGIGEILSDAPALSDGAFVIVKPEMGVSTPTAYKAFDLAENPLVPDAETMLSALSKGNLTAVGKAMENSFTAFCGVSDVERAIGELMSLGALGASMSGSGSAVFGLFESEKKAHKAAEELHGYKGVFTALPCDTAIQFEIK